MQVSGILRFARRGFSRISNRNFFRNANDYITGLLVVYVKNLV